MGLRLVSSCYSSYLSLSSGKMRGMPEFIELLLELPYKPNVILLLYQISGDTIVDLKKRL